MRKATFVALTGLVTNWISAQFSFGVGLTLTAAWAIFAFWETVTSRRYQAFVGHNKGVSVASIYMLSFLIGGGIAVGLTWLARYQSEQSPLKLSENEKPLPKSDSIAETPRTESPPKTETQLPAEQKSPRPETKPEVSKPIESASGTPPTTQPAPTTQLPDVTLRFIGAKHPALQLINISDVLAERIKYSVILWNLDLPDRIDPLPIPISTFDWIRPRQTGGPQGIFSAPNVTQLLQPGNRLFGSASVSCPNCERGRTFWVYIVWGEGGWFYEVKDMKTGEFLAPKDVRLIGKFAEQQLAQIPLEDRVPILDR